MLYKFQAKYLKLLEDFGQVVDAPVQGAAPDGTVASALTKDSIYGMTVGGGVNPRKKKRNKKGVAQEDAAYRAELKKKFPTIKRPKIENMIVGKK
jgi:hypothetical protein